MITKTQIANHALSHCGSSESISDFNEKSQAAMACSSFYDIALKSLLRAVRWPYFTRTVSLALVAEDPTMEWRFAYRMPNNTARISRILSGYKVDDESTKIPFVISSDSQGQLILTDKEEAECEIVIDNPPVNTFPSDFALALSYELAILICPKVTGGDVFNIGPKLEKKRDEAISTAIVTSQNESKKPNSYESRFARARR